MPTKSEDITRKMKRLKRLKRECKDLKAEIDSDLDALVEADEGQKTLEG